LFPYLPPVSLLSLASGPSAALPAGSQPLGLVLVIMFVTAAIVAAAFRRFKIEAIPGYLLAGALVGPHALGLISDETSVEQISELALVLLMFTLGLHLDLGSMRRGLVHIVAVGVISTLVSAALIWSLLLLLGIAKPAALIIALGASISSTAILVRTLMARREQAALHGRVSLGVSILQDLLSVIMLALIPLIVVWGGGTPEQSGPAMFTGLPDWLEKTVKGAIAISGVIVMLGVGSKLLPWILDRVSRLRSEELVLISAAAIALVCAVWTSFIGFGPAMGAFLAGFMLGQTHYRFQLSGQIAPMRDLLMAVFFTSVGLKVAPAEVAGNIGPILATLAGVIVIKIAVTALACYVAGMTAPSSLLTGVYLGNAGEFTLVLVAAGSAILSDADNGLIIAVVILSLVATPLLVGPSHVWAGRLAGLPLSRWIRSSVLREEPKPESPAEALTEAAGTVTTIDQSDLWGEHSYASVVAAPAQLERQGEQHIYSPEVAPLPAPTPAPRALPKPKRIILAGFGPVARALADRLDIQKIPYTVVELNANTVHRQHVLGRRVVYGDITNREVLENAGVHHADAIVLTIPDDEAVMRATQVIRDLNPEIFIAARTSYLSGKFTAMSLGADVVTVEEVATAVAMERDVLEGLASHLRKRG
jgi:CPA2 family monovalent cation:H+ antiporter-2